MAKTALFVPAVFALAAVAGLELLYRFDPQQAGFFPPCPLYALTGLLCPGCGSTRALHHLLHLDIGGALRMNSLMVLSIPLLGWIAYSPRVRRTRWLPWLCAAILVAYGILRNIDVYPLHLLAPH